MKRSYVFRLGVIGLLSVMGGAGPLCAWADQSRAWPVQVPYDAPPVNPEVPDVSIPPNQMTLGPEELKRVEALLPLLEGKQEFWAMGEFVHLGESSVPVLVKALTMSSPRIRYNAIETLLMMKGVAGVPALVTTAKEPSELSRVREHALRVAVRLDAAKASEADLSRAEKDIRRKEGIIQSMTPLEPSANIGSGGGPRERDRDPRDRSGLVVREAGRARRRDVERADVHRHAATLRRHGLPLHAA